jgi:predicted small secreted protein
VVAIAVLAVRQSLVLVRRAQELARRSGKAEAMQRSASESAPAVVVVTLATAAAFLPAAVMGGGPGLELLTPLAVLILAGLVTSAVVVLLVVPALYPVVADLRPPDDDLDVDRHSDTDGRAEVPGPRPASNGSASHGVSAAEHGSGAAAQPGAATGRGEGEVKRIARPYGIASLLVAAGFGLTACSSAQGAGSGDVAENPAVVEPAADGGPSTLTLTPEAEQRLGIETAAASTGDDGRPSVPYSAVVYDTEGEAWAFERIDEGTYRRTSLTIEDVVGDDALLSAGPEDGTELVTVGAAELVGVEAGISGGE